jgi:hypothetical protein
VNPERRQRLAKYVMLVSQGWAVLPAPWIILPEIENACLKQLGLAGYDLRKFAIKKGLSQLVGASGTLVDKDPRHPVPEEEISRILENSMARGDSLSLSRSDFPSRKLRRCKMIRKQRPRS